MKTLTKQDCKDICDFYINGSTIQQLYQQYNVSDRRIRKILKENDIKIRNPHEKTVSNDDYIEANKQRFVCDENHRFIAISKINGSIFEDYLNKSGSLTKHIETELHIEIPSLFKRKKYFHEHGCQWYEQWFEIECVEKNTNKIKCPYCSWETCDVENKSGMFETHLLKEHNITVEEYVKKHPESIDFFSKWKNEQEKKKFLKYKKNHVVCPICGEKMASITYTHLKHKHNMSFNEFKEKFPDFVIHSETSKEKLVECGHKANLHITKNRYISKKEKELGEYVKSLGMTCSFNRQLLIGKEIDILIPSVKIGIEYDGLKWHTEWFGKKDHMYHLNKTIKCNEKGYGLIHVFEDEYENHKELVENKIKHILKVEDNEIKIGARKCTVKEINKSVSNDFLEKYHIQGKVSASIYYGAYYNNELIGVMTFKKESKDGYWELSRYATDYHYICQGLGSKMFKHFVRENNPTEVKSFADRRWTVNADNSLYTKLGFVLENTLRPDYRYYNEEVDRFQRFHKFGFRKQILNKKYGLPLTMTETQMVQELGYDRIWDCGLFKYVWRGDHD